MLNKGCSEKELFSFFSQKKREDMNYNNILSSMCTFPHPVAVRAHCMFMETNLGDPGLFSGTASLERLLIERLGTLFHLPEAGGAAEIARNSGVEPKAWGYRIAVRRIYCGRPLTLGPRDPGEVRLWHRRKARLQPDGRMKVQGTVVRLEASIEQVVHESEQSHADELRAAGCRRVGFARRLARWLGAAVRNAPGSLAGPARRYLWIEAGWE